MENHGYSPDLCLLLCISICSRVHIISKPVPIRITLIRMTFHGIDSYS